MTKVIIYHKNCYDGFGAAWAAWKKFGKNAIYIAQEHQKPPPANLKGKEVYTLDFCFPEKETKKILKSAKSLTIIDHHISAKHITESVPNYSYALHHSGAVLAWKFFHPRKKIPKLLRHIEDIDLWKFKIKNTAEIACALELYEFDFKVLDKIAQDLEKRKNGKKIIEKGKIILEHNKGLVKRASDRAQLVVFEGYKTLAANSAIFASLTSAIGHELTKRKPPIGIVYAESGGRKRVSLRSNGKVDVSKLAAKYGGGGHRAAAAFALDINKSWPWRIIKS
ncbi:MAG: hypothetical protein HYS87_02940 [Candidatus Colwellbacteria bacterium]|nr:hypothetical protein [Candidatus Colwellbacteria bacterium]